MHTLAKQVPALMRTPKGRPRLPPSARHRTSGKGERENGEREGLFYQADFVSASDKAKALKYFFGLAAIWEFRHSTVRPLPENVQQRKLLRPVYWLGNWQFACLNYYHPPKGTRFRCVEAESFPGFMQAWVKEIESLVRRKVNERDIPPGWQLNTCLINYYGQSRGADGKWTDVARVGEHRDYEPGPVASVSLGERAFFQFVRSTSRHHTSQPALSQWLEDRSLQVFAGRLFKDTLFHRVQRVEKKGLLEQAFPDENFVVRRVNLTFRYVPNKDIQPLHEFPPELVADVAPYVQVLSKSSAHFAEAFHRISRDC